MPLRKGGRPRVNTGQRLHPSNRPLLRIHAPRSNRNISDICSQHYTLRPFPHGDVTVGIALRRLRLQDAALFWKGLAEYNAGTQGARPGRWSQSGKRCPPHGPFSPFSVAVRTPHRIFRAGCRPRLSQTFPSAVLVGTDSVEEMTGHVRFAAERSRRDQAEKANGWNATSRR